MTVATITYRDGTKGTFSSPKKELFKNKTFMQLLQIQGNQIKKIEIEYEKEKGELELL